MKYGFIEKQIVWKYLYLDKWIIWKYRYLDKWIVREQILEKWYISIFFVRDNRGIPDTPSMAGDNSIIINPKQTK